jgi:hypothetical protein
MPFFVLAAVLRGPGPRRRASAAILAGCNAHPCTRGPFTRTSERCALSRPGIGGGVRGTRSRSRHAAMSVAHVHQNGHADGRGLGVDCFFTLHACVSSATAGCPALGSHVHQECPLWRRVLPKWGVTVQHCAPPSSRSQFPHFQADAPFFGLPEEGSPAPAKAGGSGRGSNRPLGKTTGRRGILTSAHPHIRTQKNTFVTTPPFPKEGTKSKHRHRDSPGLPTARKGTHHPPKNITKCSPCRVARCGHGRPG